MNKKFVIALIFLVSLFVQARLFAQDSTDALKIDLIGMAALEEGQFVKCNYVHSPGGVMPFRPWLTNEYLRLGIKSAVNPHFTITIIPEIKLWNDTWDWALLTPIAGASNPFNQHTTVSLYDAEGTFNSGTEDDALFLNISAGVMPFKYDQEAKNLGEYLFRTAEHPAYIQTSFDQAYTFMTGLHVNAEIFKDFSVDIFFTTETQEQPLNDWSLSLLTGYKIPGYLDVGAGVMFDRLIPASGLLNKPDVGGTNSYYSSTGQLDTFNWGGTKVMARVSLDPKGFLPANVSGIFGKEDGKIYGETAILGMESITAYTHASDSNGLPIPGKFVIDSSKNFYSDIWQRIPIMLGFNIPTFKMLDYLSGEVEYYGWPYTPILYNYDGFKWVLPKPIGYSKNSPWKYSFNLRKTIWNNISIIGQIAHDHTRHDVYFNGNIDVGEIFQKQDEWGWWMKLQYSF